MQSQILPKVFCPKCLAAGRGKHNKYIMAERITVPRMTEEEGQKFYEQIKEFILQCDECESQDVKSLFPSV